MKKLTLLMMACCMALISYAQPWTITYVLPTGAVTNPYGWQSKSDMFDAFTYEQRPAFAWLTLAEYKAMEDPWSSPYLGAGFNTVDILGTPRWSWLRTYIIDFVNAWVAGGGVNPGGAVATTLATDAFNTANWRINVSAFWTERMLTMFPRSADFTAAGTIEAFQRAWKGGFVGPDEYVVADLPIALPAPYLEDMFFLGWFTAPNGGGVRMNTIPAGRTGDITLYAHFGPDPIYTAADIAREVAANRLAVGDEVFSMGVVTFVMGNTIFLQAAADGSAMTVSFATLPADVTVGRELLVEGTIAPMGSLFVLTNARVEANDSGNLPSLVESASLEILDANKFRYVRLLGITVTAVSGNNISVRDLAGLTTTVVGTLPSGIAVNSRINVLGVVSYDGTNTGLIAINIAQTLAGLPDPSVYNPISFGTDENMVTLTLTNKWLISNRLENHAANPIATAQASRSMAARNGRMYFPDRVTSGGGNENHGLVVVDAATGNRIERINFRDTDVFRRVVDRDLYPDSIGSVLGFSFNDVKLDCAGNMLAINLAPAGSISPFQIWVIDTETPANSRLLFNVERFVDLVVNPPLLNLPNARIDYFDVFGDVNGDAIIMAALGGTANVYKWYIVDGQVYWHETFPLDFSAPGTTIYGLSTLSTAAYIFIVDETLFFIDTMNDAPPTAGVPILFDMDGEVIDGFHNILDDSIRTAAMPHVTPVGLTEFSLSGFNFIVTAHGNTNSPTPSTFQLLKYDGRQEFEDLKPMWIFPAQGGLGGGSNPGRSAVPSVTVNEAEGYALIHVWYVDVGYGVYRLDIDVRNNVDEVFTHNDVVNMFVEGNVVRMDKEVAQISVFSVTGQLITVGINSTEIRIPATGVFLVRALTHDGQTAVDRVIIR